MSIGPNLDELLYATAARDQEAFSRLYLATSAKLYGIVLRILRRQDWADEVLQEVYLRIWNKADQFHADRGAPMAWMIGIARNRALDWRRSDHGEISVDPAVGSETWIDPAADPLDRAILSAQARALLGCLDHLKDAQRSCIILAFLEGYTHEELALRLDRPIGTVKSWIRRGQTQLKDCLGI